MGRWASSEATGSWDDERMTKFRVTGVSEGWGEGSGVMTKEGALRGLCTS